jgi:glycosyltransferase involved in cell wall biosynthesis
MTDISIIIPIYKGKKYLLRLRQMLEVNCYNLKKNTMEVIFVNDYPKEKILLNDFSTNFKVTLINNYKNLGIHRSRVAGLEASNGNYILFLDQDDEIEDTYLTEQLYLIQKNNADVVVSNGFYMNPDGNKKMIYQSDKHLKCCKDIKCFINFTNPIISPGQVLIKKDAIPQEWKEYYFTENGADDFYLWLLMLYYEKKFYVNPRFLYTHVFTGENTSFQSEKMMKSINEMIDVLHDKYSFFKLWKIKRRNMYSVNYSKKLLHRIRYLDVCINRKLYYLIYISSFLK